MVGTDIIEVARIEKLIKEKGDKFLNRIYIENEIDYCESKGPNKYQHYAGRFAAKEAIFKAMYNTFGEKVSFRDICVFHEEDGTTNVYIHNEEKYDAIVSAYRAHLSISHIKEYAIAVVSLDVNND